MLIELVIRHIGQKLAVLGARELLWWDQKLAHLAHVAGLSRGDHRVYYELVLDCTVRVLQRIGIVGIIHYAFACQPLAVVHLQLLIEDLLTLSVVVQRQTVAVVLLGHKVHIDGGLASALPDLIGQEYHITILGYLWEVARIKGQIETGCLPNILGLLIDLLFLWILLFEVVAFAPCTLASQFCFRAPPLVNCFIAILGFH